MLPWGAPAVFSIFKNKSLSFGVGYTKNSHHIHAYFSNGQEQLCLLTGQT